MLRRKNVSQSKKIGRLFRTLGQPARLRILMAIGRGEACVCHLEAMLGYRQAYISQHLMALREVNLVSARRDGRNIYYHITDLAFLDLLQEAKGLVDLTGEEMAVAEAGAKAPGCICPHCVPEKADLPLISAEGISVTSG